MIILHEYKSLTHKLHSRWDHVFLQYAGIGRSNSIFPSPWANPRLSNRQKPPPPPRHNSLLHALQLMWYRGLQLFAVHRPFYLSQKFLTLIRQSKELYSAVLFSSLCASRPTGAFWHCFASSTEVSWQQFCYICQLHWVLSSQGKLTHFFHNIGSVVQWCLKKSAFWHTSWWLWINCLLHLVKQVVSSKQSFNTIM